MIERIPTPEAKRENPTYEDVLAVFNAVPECSVPTEVTSWLHDEEGVLYFLRAEGVDKDGDKIHLTFQRAGRTPFGVSADTVIDAVFFMGDVPVGGRTVARWVDGQFVYE